MKDFKIGDIVKCIIEPDINGLTKGKTYIVKWVSYNYIEIIDDDNITWPYNVDKFLSICEIRNEIIDDILS